MDRVNPSTLVASRANIGQQSAEYPTVIAIPACNEAERILECLSALSVQRDARGRRIAPDAYEVLLYANNCRDGTAEIVRLSKDAMSMRVEVIEADIRGERAAAGLARKTVMDLAADRLEAAGLFTGVILTTDADSVVAPTWLANSWHEFAEGADCVAGYVDANPRELIELSKDFQHRGFLEESYHASVAEIFALLDPRPHDPWPNHQVASGASLGVTLTTYRAIGGLPTKAAGEDAALALAVECANGKVRHSMHVVVSTSCRLTGRAAGGAADAMKLRHAITETPCDDELESAFTVVKKAWLKGHLRKASTIGFMRKSAIFTRLGLSPEQAAGLNGLLRRTCFEVFWQNLCNVSPVLGYHNPLRPSMLASEIVRAEAFLRFLRTQTEPLKAVDLLMEDGASFEARLNSLREQVGGDLATQWIIGKPQPMAEKDLPGARR